MPAGMNEGVAAAVAAEAAPTGSEATRDMMAVETWDLVATET